jgi:3-oxoacyl-[acyl-carrier-protein] synthase III
MSGSTIPPLATRVSVTLTGTGSFQPETSVSNAQMLERLHPARPDGRMIEPEWIDRHLGIYERRLDYDFVADHKLSRADGGLYDGDLALRAGRAALDDAGIDGGEVDIVVHVTTTPDTLACDDHFRYLTTELGLRRDVELVHHNVGCAGLAPAFRTAACSLIALAPATALVIASNCPSGYFGRDVHPYYRNHPSGLAWVSAFMFADGAGAAVLRSQSVDPDEPARGLLSVRYESIPDIELVTYPAGGCLARTRVENVGDHLFVMDARKVAEVFAPLMHRDFDMLQEDWPVAVKPAVGSDFDIDAVDRWYLHQANGIVVREAIKLLGLPPERVPISVDHYGNTSAACTLVLLDEDRRAGRVKGGDLLAFLWIGAGNGAMNGCATMVL